MSASRAGALTGAAGHPDGVALEDLAQAFPHPVQPVNWTAGWVGTPPLSVARLRKLGQDRAAACHAVFNWHRLGPAECTAGLAALAAYADGLRALTEAPIAAARHVPLTFAWSFPFYSAGTRSPEDGPRRRVVLNAPVPGYERLAVLCTAALLRHQAAHQAADPDALQDAADHCDGLAAELPETALNPAQWSYLVNQGLPIQLRPEWLRYLAAASRHRRSHLRARPQLRGPPTAARQSVAATQATADGLVVAARRLLFRQRGYHPPQCFWAALVYQRAQREAHRIRAIALLLDATAAVHIPGALHLARHMTDACARSLATWRSVEDDATTAAAEPEPADPPATQLRRELFRIQDLLAYALPVYEDPGETAVLDFRSGLGA